jgi:UDP-glucose 4-epimerase
MLVSSLCLVGIAISLYHLSPMILGNTLGFSATASAAYHAVCGAEDYSGALPARATKPTAVLVTGGAGFIGSHVALHCAEAGMKVVVVDDLSGGFTANVPQHENIKFVRGDVKDAQLLEELFRTHSFDYVYHLAAYAAEGLSHFIRSYNYRNNLVASVELLNMAIKHDVQCFVFTSSIAVYGAGQTPMTESTPPQPEDPYGIAKYAFELDLQAAHEMFGMDYIVFRPHNVYGPGQNIYDKYRNVIGIFIYQLLNNATMTIFGDGEQTRCFSYIDDVAPIIAKAPLMGARVRNQVYNLGSDIAYDLNRISREINAAMRMPAFEVEHLPERLEVKHAISDHKKMNCFFELPQASLSLREGIEATVEWVLSRGKYFQAVEFSGVEVKRNMPPSWVTPGLGEVTHVAHTIEDNQIEMDLMRKTQHVEAEKTGDIVSEREGQTQPRE